MQVCQNSANLRRIDIRWRRHEVVHGGGAVERAVTSLHFAFLTGRAKREQPAQALVGRVGGTTSYAAFVLGDICVLLLLLLFKSLFVVCCVLIHWLC